MHNVFKVLFIFYIISQASFCFGQESDAELLSYETKISVEKNKLYKSISCEVRINNRDGDIYSNVSIPYSKLHKVFKVKGFIKDISGKTIRRLKRGEITDRSAISSFSLYEDDFVKEFSLKHNRYPYVISYSYKVVQKEFVYIDYWIPALNSMIPTRKAVLEVNIPNDFKISFKSHLVDSVEIDSLDSRMNYRWISSYEGDIKNELFSPPFSTIAPSVAIVPQKLKFEYDASFESWLTYGNWQYELIKDLSDLPLSEKRKIEKLIEGIDDEKEQVKVLYNYLQDATRYINISIETGGLKPYPASYVAKNKYGDCKALSNYFKSVLESIGIKSFYTTVHAGGPVVNVDKSIPSQQFNHVILNVPLKNDTLWLDCTSDGAFNHLGTFTQNRDAFIVDYNDSRLARTPKLSKWDVLNTRVIDISPDIDNGAIANFNNSYKGDKYESLFGLSCSLGDSRKSIIIRNKYIERGFEVDDYNIVLSHRDSSKISLLYSAKSDGIYKNYGDDILIKLIPFSIPSFEPMESRKLSVQLDYPIYKRDTLSYVIPNGYYISNLPKKKSFQTKYGEYKLQFFPMKNRIKLVKSFLLYPQYITVDKYSDFYNFLYRVYNIENTTHIVTTKQK